MASIALAGTKGGTGTSTLAAAIAIVEARHRYAPTTNPAGMRAYTSDPDAQPVAVASTRPDDLAAFYGAPGTSDVTAGPVTVTPGIAHHDLAAVAVGTHAQLSVADCGRLDDLARLDAVTRLAWESADARILVTRADYLGLRAAMHTDALEAVTAVVMVDEPGRALTRREVADVLGRPVIARIPVRDTIARAVDAGLLASRCPDALANPAGLVAARMLFSTRTNA